MIIGTQLSIKELMDGVYETIRLELVSKGYLPDKRLSSNNTEWAAAISVHRLNLPSGKEIINIVGDQNISERKKYEVNTIYINYDGKRVGDLRGSKIYYEQYTDGAQEKYKKLRSPDSAEDIDILISFGTLKVARKREIEELLLNSLGSRRYLKGRDSNNAELQEFLIIGSGYVDISDDKLDEIQVRYTIKDVYLVGHTEEETGIARAEIITPIVGENEAVDNIE